MPKSTDAGLAAWRAFLEGTPPNVAVDISGLYGRHHPNAHNDPWSIPPVDIELFCEHDDGSRLFRTKDYVFGEVLDFKFVSYTCKKLWPAGEDLCTRTATAGQ